MRRILVVEDDPDIALSLKYNMEKEGAFSVVVAEDGESGLAEAARRPPELIVLDLNLPGIDGFEVCRRLRTGSATSTIPIIMLTARIEEVDKVAGLELGADDYVTKPFSVKEIIARARAILRRAQTPHEDKEILSSGVLTLDLGARQVLVDDREVALTRKEFDLLADLVQGRGRVLSRELLLERVWGYDHPGETRTVDVHVRQLRKKLGPPADGYIETVVGVGYRFRGDS
jgi:two-component system alkaline phosphatase synthesis response regulator PhoP